MDTFRNSGGKYNSQAHHDYSWASLVAQMIKNLPANAGDTASTPGSGRSLEGEYGNPLQYCLENLMDRGVWQVTVHGVAKSRTRLSD